jgi:hypothetical protein
LKEEKTMKKILVLVALLVFVAVPAFAQHNIVSASGGTTYSGLISASSTSTVGSGGMVFGNGFVATGAQNSSYGNAGVVSGAKTGPWGSASLGDTGGGTVTLGPNSSTNTGTVLLYTSSGSEGGTLTASHGSFAGGGAMQSGTGAGTVAEPEHIWHQYFKSNINF